GRVTLSKLMHDTNSALDLLQLALRNAGPYSVLVSNPDGGSVVSDTAWLSVLPTNVVTVAGQEFRFGSLSPRIWKAARADDEAPNISGDGLSLIYASKAPGG